MARTTFVASARRTKDGTRPTCFTCQKPIEVGQAYAWNQPNRFSARYQWHQSCRAPRGSVLESNEKRGQAYAAFEDAYDALDAVETDKVEDTEDGQKALIDELKGIAEQCAEGIREAAEMWRESASNIEDGFGHETERSQEMNDHADTYESAADTAEQAGDSVDDRDQFDTIEEWAEATVATFREDLESAEGEID